MDFKTKGIDNMAAAVADFERGYVRCEVPPVVWPMRLNANGEAYDASTEMDQAMDPVGFLERPRASTER